MRDLTKRVSSETFLFKQSHRVTIHLLPHEGKLLLAVYDKDRKTIATFLPLDAGITKRHPEIKDKIKKAHENMGLEYPLEEPEELKSNPTQSAS